MAGYEDMTRVELQKLARTRGVPATGTKAEIAGRLTRLDLVAEAAAANAEWAAGRDLTVAGPLPPVALPPAVVVPPPVVLAAARPAAPGAVTHGEVCGGKEYEAVYRVTTLAIEDHRRLLDLTARLAVEAGRVPLAVRRDAVTGRDGYWTATYRAVLRRAGRV